MDYSLVKQALADAVKQAEIPKLTCYSYLPDNPELPCFFAGEVRIKVNNSFGGYDEASIVCGIFTSQADDKDGQRRLDELISRTGPKSIREALYTYGSPPGQHALGGLCDDIVIDSIDGYGVISLGDDKNFYGANLTVRLIGKGDA